ncbi:FecR family protein [Oceanospirillum beijerinckii]|uniref:FecR family protein n=1 Tax=Oceanospirillum beijerinckii TaxID=64976 RepID=UPI000419331D|nr:FecR family protein [Oceanospirillum beijerinckii]
MTVLDHCAVKNLPRTLFVLLMSCAVCLSSLVHATEKEAIGEVLFAVGDRWKQDAAGSHPIKPKRGTALYAGDVLSTAETGFLQLKMIDGGFISLRSNSRLRINSYKYNPENPEENKVNLSLEEGVVRSVTGKAGESNRKRFRLNTPIAAIGVRGTDFTVYTDVNQSQVAVARGGDCD